MKFGHSKEIRTLDCCEGRIRKLLVVLERNRIRIAMVGTLCFSQYFIW